MSNLSMHLCRGCNEIFGIPSRRGRPPVFCNSCKESNQKTTKVAVTTTHRTPIEIKHRVAPIEPKKRTIVVREDKFTGELADPNGIRYTYLDGVKMSMLYCHACKEVFGVPARAGKPSEYCSSCIDSGRAQLMKEQKVSADVEKARKRVDNLEMLLRSRGTHISQNRHRWE